jgi:hypothetical protein
MKLSKSNQYTILAKELGYYITKEGIPYGKKRKLKGQFKKGYHCITIRNGNNINWCLPVHKLQAYQKFGNDMFKPHTHVRHLDNNSLNNHYDNLALGTPKENHLDIPRDMVIKRARNAAKILRKLTNEQASNIRKESLEGAKGNYLAKKYQVSTSCISQIINNTYYQT